MDGEEAVTGDDCGGYLINIVYQIGLNNQLDKSDSIL